MMALPYAEELGERNPVEVIAETPAKFAAAFARVTEAEADAPTAPGKWSLREIACHLADCELVWAWRLRTVFERDIPTIVPFDQDVWARAYQSYSLPQALDVFKAMRAWNIEFVHGLSEADLHRPYVHPERGGEELLDLVRIMAGHDLHHVQLLQA